MDLKSHELEIRRIIYELKDVESGIFYEEGHVPGTASAKTIARNVREIFEDMIERIAEDKPGRIAEAFQNIKDKD